MSEETIPQFETYAESHEYPYDHVALAIKDGGEIFHTDLSRSYLPHEREQIYDDFAALVHRANTQHALLAMCKKLLRATDPNENPVDMEPLRKEAKTLIALAEKQD